MAGNGVKSDTGEFWLKALSRLSELSGRKRAGAIFRRGKIEPPSSCEINAVDHCNQSCLDCNHGAPAQKERFADPGAVRDDLSALSKSYRPGFIKVLGGEPLLHPNLRSILEAVRSSGICDDILLVTNGLLLAKMPDEIWDTVDGVEVSIYPGGSITKRALAGFRKKSEERGKKLSAFFYERFRVTMSTAGTRDDELVARIFRTCKMGNEWGCHTIHQGHFFRCPQSVYLPRIVNDPELDPNVDGLRISDSPDFTNRLFRFINSRTPLESCRYCLGHAGIIRRHRGVPSEEWVELHREPTEKLVDFDRLKRAEKGLEDRDISIVAVDENSDLLPD